MDYDGNVNSQPAEEGQQSSPPNNDDGIRFNLGFVKTPPGVLMVVNIVCLSLTIHFRV